MLRGSLRTICVYKQYESHSTEQKRQVNELMIEGRGYRFFTKVSIKMHTCCMKKILLLAALVLLPVTGSAQEWGSAQSKRFETLSRAAARREARLMRHALQEQMAPRVVRFQRRVVQLPFSPRRLLSMEQGRVIDVMDGIIFTVLKADGTMQEVRMLGVDAPEIINTRTGQHCYSLEARAALEDRILGATVFLQKENGYNRDSYRRKVRFVQFGGRDIGAWMIRNGFAFADKKHPHSHSSRYADLERNAKEEDRGLWSFRCDYDLDSDELIRISN